MKGAYFFMAMDPGIAQELYVYRPVLCTELMKRGFKGERIPNIYFPDKNAWSFPLSVDLCKFAIDYYNNTLNKSAPRILIDYLAEHEGEDHDQ